MVRVLFTCILFVLLGSAAPTSAGVLTDHGAHGEFFHDGATGLYWLDPAHFADATRGWIDEFATDSYLWSWATSVQVEALVGSTAPAGQALVDVMGPALEILSEDRPRWNGFHSDVNPPDGWLVQSDTDPTPVQSRDWSGVRNLFR